MLRPLPTFLPAFLPQTFPASFIPFQIQLLSISLVSSPKKTMFGAIRLLFLLESFSKKRTRAGKVGIFCYWLFTFIEDRTLEDGYLGFSLGASFGNSCHPLRRGPNSALALLHMPPLLALPTKPSATHPADCPPPTPRGAGGSLQVGLLAILPFDWFPLRRCLAVSLRTAAGWASEAWQTRNSHTSLLSPPGPQNPRATAPARLPC